MKKVKLIVLNEDYFFSEIEQYLIKDKEKENLLYGRVGANRSIRRCKVSKRNPYVVSSKNVIVFSQDGFFDPETTLIKDRGGISVYLQTCVLSMINNSESGIKTALYSESQGVLFFVEDFDIVIVPLGRDGCHTSMSDYDLTAYTREFLNIPEDALDFINVDSHTCYKFSADTIGIKISKEISHQFYYVNANIIDVTIPEELQKIPNLIEKLGMCALYRNSSDLLEFREVLLKINSSITQLMKCKTWDEVIEVDQKLVKDLFEDSSKDADYFTRLEISNLKGLRKYLDTEKLITSNVCRYFKKDNTVLDEESNIIKLLYPDTNVLCNSIFLSETNLKGSVAYPNVILELEVKKSATLCIPSDLKEVLNNVCLKIGRSHYISDRQCSVLLGSYSFYSPVIKKAKIIKISGEYLTNYSGGIRINLVKNSFHALMGVKLFTDEAIHPIEINGVSQPIELRKVEETGCGFNPDLINIINKNENIFIEEYPKLVRFSKIFSEIIKSKFKCATELIYELLDMFNSNVDLRGRFRLTYWGLGEDTDDVGDYLSYHYHSRDKSYRWKFITCDYELIVDRKFLNPKRRDLLKLYFLLRETILSKIPDPTIWNRFGLDLCLPTTKSINKNHLYIDLDEQSPNFIPSNITNITITGKIEDINHYLIYIDQITDCKDIQLVVK